MLDFRREGMAVRKQFGNTAFLLFRFFLFFVDILARRLNFVTFQIHSVQHAGF